jgi:primosomal protein N' (replication factor Y)
MKQYVRVSVNVPQITGVFDYHLPENLIDGVGPGSLVIVPFGKQTVQGVVLKRIPEPAVEETRAVEALLDPEPVLTQPLLALAEGMAAQTFSTLSSWIDLMLPPGLSQQADTLYTLSKTPNGQDDLPPLQLSLVELLKKRGSLRGRQLEAAFTRQNWKAAAQTMGRRGLLQSQPVLPPPRVRPKIVRTVQLFCPADEVVEHFDQLGRGVAAIRRRAILEFLVSEPWPLAVTWAYAVSGGNLADLEWLADRGLVVLGESEVWRDPLEKIEFLPYDPPILTGDQDSVLQKILPVLERAVCCESVLPILLHGVTSSGKTEIYLRVAAEALRLGRQVLILVPEIALTPQTVRRFMGRFPGQVGLIHSRLTPGERYDTWRRARSGQLPLIVGPRSALFSPLPAPGLIIIDECHDESYYQSDPPFYHAVQAAVLYARLSGSALLLGSATPGVELMHRAQREQWTVLDLPNRLLAHRQTVIKQLSQMGLSDSLFNEDGGAATLPMPPVKVVDMRQELKAGNRSIFSRSLLQGLKEVIDSGQQAILFLNRRGSATYIFCRDCGQPLLCPRCDLPLTCHSEGGESLVCHSCNYHRKIPVTCPQCSSKNISRLGTGTEKVESEVLSLFPQARTLRWDAETARMKGADDIILSHFSGHRADILIGTQMIAKGLDLPLVTLVGVILADVGLNFPDFRAPEHAFQLLTQVFGRAGRSPLGGKVVLQTYNPNNYAIQAAAAYDFAGFYKTELDYRRRMGYPPFSRLVRLEMRHLQADKVEEAACRMAAQLQAVINNGEHHATRMIGPAPCFFSRLNGYYRWHIILSGPNPAELLRGFPLGDWRVEVDPPELL